MKRDPVPTKLSNWDAAFQKDVGCVTPEDRVSPRCRELTRLIDHGVDDARVGQVIRDVEEALPGIHETWATAFRRSGLTFSPPVVRYYGYSIPGIFQLQPNPPVCRLKLENAFYCPPGHEIYYDAIFLARVADVVRQETKTTGRYAVISAVAHEMGHAVDATTGAAAAHVAVGEAIEHRQERLADCFAGAIVAALSQRTAGASQAARMANSGTPRTEGQMALYFIGGPVAGKAHDTGPARAGFFAEGFSGGIAGCAPQTFRSTAEP